MNDNDPNGISYIHFADYDFAS